MSEMTQRFTQMIFMDSALHEIIFEWRTDRKGGVMEVVKVSRGPDELKGIALLNFWSMMNMDHGLSVTVVPNILNDGYENR